ncbi:MAG: radical SAM protein [Anderseniella sp.]
MTYDVAIIRPVDHAYKYAQWHEDIAICYLCTALKRKGFEYRVYDFALEQKFCLEKREHDYREITSSGAKCVVWVLDKHPTNNPYYGLQSVSEMASAVGHICHFSVYGNTQIDPFGFFELDEIDSVVVGEESAFISLLENLDVEPSERLTEGVLFRGQTFSKQAPLKRTSLNELGHAERYFLHEAKAGRPLVAAIQASRGCYAKCSFCFIRAKEAMHGGYGWQSRRPDDVVQEIAEIIEKYGVFDFAFVDPQLIGPGKTGKEWVHSLACQILSLNEPKIRFSIYARANDIDEENIRLLKAAGLYAVFIGVESFSQSMLNRLKKGMTVERNLRAIRLLMDNNIMLRMGFISFDAHTTMLEVLENCSGLKKVMGWKPHLITQPVFFNTVLVPLADTPKGQEYSSAGLIKKNAEQEPNWREVDAKNMALMDRLNRGQGATIIREPKVRLLNEFTRILSSELVQRSTSIENAVSDHLLGIDFPGNADHELLESKKIREWFAGLSEFAISQLVLSAEQIESVHSAEDSLLDQLVSDMRDELERYDRRVFRKKVPTWSDAQLELVD